MAKAEWATKLLQTSILYLLKQGYTESFNGFDKGKAKPPKHVEHYFCSVSTLLHTVNAATSPCTSNNKTGLWYNHTSINATKMNFTNSQTQIKKNQR